MARILVTSSRTPFALDAIRKLATAGHEVAGMSAAGRAVLDQLER
jgi:hypothetical protein